MLIECYELLEKTAIAYYDTSAAGIRGYRNQAQIAELQTELQQIRHERDDAHAHAEARERSFEGLLGSTRDWLEIADRRSSDQRQRIDEQAAELASLKEAIKKLRALRKQRGTAPARADAR